MRTRPAVGWVKTVRIVAAARAPAPHPSGTGQRHRSVLSSRGGGRPAAAQTGEGAVVDAAQEQQGAGGT
ncbi:hypothetical protein ACLVWO_36665, partial [Streptomyces sp. CWNU-52H]|uniref:hypothetical protein n=1 Tax=Streptomyces sp. CWNU-52H TaxID=3394352 RepID=UPI0039BF003F